MDRTKNLKLTIRGAAIVGALVLALLAGCASGVSKRTAEDTVAERSQARWDALLAGDFAAAYGYYSPGFRSKASATDLELKVRLQRVRWTGAKYRDDSCVEDSCTVRVDVTYEVHAPVPGVTTWKGSELIKEKWIKTDGEWWYVPPST